MNKYVRLGVVVVLLLGMVGESVPVYTTIDSHPSSPAQCEALSALSAWFLRAMDKKSNVRVRKPLVADWEIHAMQSEDPPYFLEFYRRSMKFIKTAFFAMAGLFVGMGLGAPLLRPNIDETPPKLLEMQSRILELLAEGSLMREIPAALETTIRNLDYHVGQIKSKLKEYLTRTRGSSNSVVRERDKAPLFDALDSPRSFLGHWVYRSGLLQPTSLHRSYLEIRAFVADLDAAERQLFGAIILGAGSHETLRQHIRSVKGGRNSPKTIEFHIKNINNKIRSRFPKTKHTFWNMADFVASVWNLPLKGLSAKDIAVILGQKKIDITQESWSSRAPPRLIVGGAPLVAAA